MADLDEGGHGSGHHFVVVVCNDAFGKSSTIQRYCKGIFKHLGATVELNLVDGWIC